MLLSIDHMLAAHLYIQICHSWIANDVWHIDKFGEPTNPPLVKNMMVAVPDHYFEFTAPLFSYFGASARQK